MSGKEIEDDCPLYCPERYYYLVGFWCYKKDQRVITVS